MRISSSEVTCTTSLRATSREILRVRKSTGARNQVIPWIMWATGTASVFACTTPIVLGWIAVTVGTGTTKPVANHTGDVPGNVVKNRSVANAAPPEFAMVLNTRIAA